MVRMDLEMTRVSSKGQVVIPGLIRERLGLTGGSRLLVFGEGDTIILKKVGLASQETRETLASVRKKIRELRVTREDVSREIRAVRKERARRGPVETAAGSRHKRPALRNILRERKRGPGSQANPRG